MAISKVTIDNTTHDIVSGGVTYCTCATAAATAAKVATVVSGNFNLFTGARVVVKFTYANSAASPTLNVDGTGAKSIMRYGTTAAGTGTTTSGWIAGAVQAFTYDGTNWVQDYWNNTTYSNASLGQGYATCTTEAATVAKVGSLSSYKLVTGGIVAVRFSYDVPANATLNINSTGAKAIYYNNAKITDGVIKAGDIATFVYSSYYRLIAIDKGITVTADRALVSDSSGKMSASAVTATELGYLDGVTSNIQTQLNTKAASSNVYTKTETDTAIANAASSSSEPLIVAVTGDDTNGYSINSSYSVIWDTIAARGIGAVFLYYGSSVYCLSRAETPLVLRFSSIYVVDNTVNISTINIDCNNAVQIYNRTI